MCYKQIIRISILIVHMITGIHSEICCIAALVTDLQLCLRFNNLNFIPFRQTPKALSFHQFASQLLFDDTLSLIFTRKDTISPIGSIPIRDKKQYNALVYQVLVGNAVGKIST